MRQCLQLLAEFPIFSVYSYAASSFYNNDDSLVIHRPRADYSTAENILHMLRQDTNFSRLEAKVLDMALVLHAEHGGGNNSSFTMHVVTSSGTDTGARLFEGPPPRRRQHPRRSDVRRHEEEHRRLERQGDRTVP